MITGASSGLGAALAREYATPGRNLVLAARRPDLLRKVEQECVARSANVYWKQIDIRDAGEVEAWLEEMERTAPIDLFVANAGIFSGHGADGQMEDPEDISEQITTNLLGTISTTTAVARRMKKRGRGHIAMVSSLAALQPLADAPVYSASKAGIMAYGDALREYLAEDNITVSTIFPGHIATAQTAVHAGALYGALTAQYAAQIIRKRLEHRQTFIAFPRRMQWIIQLGRLLPWRMRAWANRPFRFHVRPVAEVDVAID